MPRPEDLVWQLMAKSAMLPFKAAGAVVRASARASSNAGARGASRLPYVVKKTGILAPGDPPPPPGPDLLDYRGVALPRDVQNLRDGPIPLGRVYNCRRGPAWPIGLQQDQFFRHAAVIGPAGSGKTYSIIVPWIVSLLRSGCSVVTIDVKGDLQQQIAAHAAATGGPTGAQLRIWDYSGRPSHRWNWLAEVTDSRSLEAAVQAILGKPNKGDPQPFFYQRDVRWLRALISGIQAKMGSRAAPADLSEILNDQDNIRQLVARYKAGKLNDLARLDVDQYSLAVQGLQNALAIFEQPTVRQVTSASDFTLRNVQDRATLLVGVAPIADGALGETLSSLLASLVMSSVLGRFGTNPRPLAFVIDEAPRLKNRIDFEQLLAVARGASVGVCIACQDVAQFGNDTARSAVFANCDTMVVMPGSSDETATFLTRRLGDRLIETQSVTRTGGSTFSPTYAVSGSVASGPVLGKREIMHPPFGPRTAIVHVRSEARMPILADLTY